jgi:C1A family cysteine protease
MPVFGAAAYDLWGSGEGKLSLPFKCLLDFDPSFGPSESQTTGDCVSHSTRNAIDVTRAVEIKNGEHEEFVARGATEAIYQSRGHKQQGMTCSGATRYVYENGGILVRKDYGDIDLSVYNSSLGANHRIPNSIYKTEAQKHQVKTVSNVRTVEEARDALANGYALSVCSGYGFSSRRDTNGIAKRGSGWSHAMAWIACDDTRERLNETLFLVQNSWGMWNAGPKVHGQPEGSFWIREQDARGMLSGGGAWVYSDVDGFPPRDIKYTIDEVF